MTQRIFIIPGDRSQMSRFEACLSDEVCGILVHQRTDVSDLDLSGEHLKDRADIVFTINSLLRFTGESIGHADLGHYRELLDFVFGDTRVHYLAQRSNYNSAFNNAIVIDKVLQNSLSIIRRTNPSYLIASSAPHSLEAWLFAKCFEYLRLPIYILESTPIAFRSWVYRGLDTQSVVPLSNGVGCGELTPESRMLVENQRASRPGAKDEKGYHVSRIYLNSVPGSDSNKWWSYRRELKWLLSGRLVSLPIRLYSTILKKQLLSSYQKVATSIPPKGPFVVFFMHYQPERSSLPVGLFYVQQWFAVRLLSLSMPKGWTLLVREHPTTWLKPIDISVRSKSLYADIASLQRTEICSMEADTFELIDQCAAVATLTGNVGFQALLRNKPVIAFGLAGYKDHPACFSVSEYSGLAKAFEEIETGSCNKHFSDERLQEYLLWLEQHSVNADPKDDDWISSRQKNFAEIYRQVFSGELVLG